MKKYEVNFVASWDKQYKWGQEGSEFWQNRVSKEQADFCTKWRGKKITLAEAEENIQEFLDVWGGGIIFDGEDITIYNGWNE